MGRTIRREQRDKPGQLLLVADAERHCVLCGRRLRGDKSVERQYGPTCWRKRNSEEEPVLSPTNP